jgi:ribosome-associated protein
MGMVLSFMPLVKKPGPQDKQCLPLVSKSSITWAEGFLVFWVQIIHRAGGCKERMSAEQVSGTKTGTYRDKVKSIVQWLEDKKAKDIVALDVQAMNNLTEAVLIVSAATTRHAQALADGLLQYFKEQGHELLGMEGYQMGTWILIDANDVVIHIFQEQSRSFYHLESLWAEAPRLHG